MHLYREVYISISALFNSAYNFRLLCHLIYVHMHLRENFTHICICILEKISLTQALWCYMLDCPPVCVQKHLICILIKKIKMAILIMIIQLIVLIIIGILNVLHLYIKWTIITFHIFWTLLNLFAWYDQKWHLISKIWSFILDIPVPVFSFPSLFEYIFIKI